MKKNQHGTSNLQEKTLWLEDRAIQRTRTLLNMYILYSAVVLKHWRGVEGVAAPGGAEVEGVRSPGYVMSPGDGSRGKPSIPAGPSHEGEALRMINSLTRRSNL